MHRITFALLQTNTVEALAQTKHQHNTLTADAEAAHKQSPVAQQQQRRAHKRRQAQGKRNILGAV